MVCFRIGAFKNIDGLLLMLLQLLYSLCVCVYQCRICLVAEKAKAGGLEWNEKNSSSGNNSQARRKKTFIRPSFNSFIDRSLTNLSLSWLHRLFGLWGPRHTKIRHWCVPLRLQKRKGGLRLRWKVEMRIHGNHFYDKHNNNVEQQKPKYSRLQHQRQLCTVAIWWRSLIRWYAMRFAYVFPPRVINNKFEKNKNDTNTNWKF